MPIPVMAGIPWLAGVIGSLLAGLVAWFSQYLTKRLAVVAAVVSLVVVLTASFLGYLNTAIAGLALAIPTEYAAGVAMVCPSNLTACLGLVMTARAVRFAYEWNIRVIQYKLL